MKRQTLDSIGVAMMGVSAFITVFGGIALFIATMSLEQPWYAIVAIGSWLTGGAFGLGKLLEFLAMIKD